MRWKVKIQHITTTNPLTGALKRNTFTRCPVITRDTPTRDGAISSGIAVIRTLITISITLNMLVTANRTS